ncbi:MAG: PilZ domain-containing protein [Planctomycetota bacterium]
MKATIVLADGGEGDRKMFMEAIKGTPYEVVGEAAHGDGMIEAVELLKPWCVAIDLKLPGHAAKPGDGGSNAVRHLVDKYPKVKVLILHNADTVHLVMGAVHSSHGVRVRKPIKRESLLEALTKLASGQEGELGIKQIGVKLKKTMLMTYKLTSDGFFTKKRECLTVEVGDAGFQVQLQEKLAKGSVLVVELDLPNEQPVKAKCQVTKIDPEPTTTRFNAELSFVEIAQPERDRLKGFLRRLMERGTGIIKA